MPRPNPPPPVTMPVIKQFKLEAFQRAAVARTLGHTLLPPEAAAKVEHYIACYHATEGGNPDTTVANTIAAVNEVLAHGRTYDRAVKRIADDKSGIDYTTHARLQPLALAVMHGEASAKADLDRAAKEERGRLLAHQRIVAKAEALRFFCGMLNNVFKQHAALGMAWTLRNRRLFALEVLAAAGVEEPDFEAHPERLNEYLDADVGGAV